VDPIPSFKKVKITKTSPEKKEINKNKSKRNCPKTQDPDPR